MSCPRRLASPLKLRLDRTQCAGNGNQGLRLRHEQSFIHHSHAFEKLPNKWIGTENLSRPFFQHFWC